MSARGNARSRAETESRILSRERCEAVWRRVAGFARGGGETELVIAGWWSGGLRWARNRASLASDRRDVLAKITRTVGERVGEVYVNQLDDVTLEEAVREAERCARLFGPRVRRDFHSPPPKFDYATPAIWSEATFTLPTEARTDIARAATEPAEAAGLSSAGYLELRAMAIAAFADARTPAYTQFTQAQCSMTVRDPQGGGSGWAGLSGYDWAAIDPGALAERALQKAIASRNPVALEPGRYTVILEPQAVHDLVTLVIDALSRELPEVQRGGPFVLGSDPALELTRSKLGLKVADERVTIGHDPMDPLLGVVPFAPDGVTPYRAVTWIDRGVLATLADRRGYALATRNDNLGYANSGAFRMSGGDASVDDMIRTTKRGLLVSRFSNVRLLDWNSLLATGLTRDGVWLIENGRISKAVRNFRFTESPLFVLNSLEELGHPVPVFRPGRSLFEGGAGPDQTYHALIPAIVPPVKARDFSFTAPIDAI